MNIQKLMKQAQQMQEKLLREQGDTVVEAIVGGVRELMQVVPLCVCMCVCVCSCGYVRMPPDTCVLTLPHTYTHTHTHTFTRVCYSQ